MYLFLICKLVISKLVVHDLFITVTLTLTQDIDKLLTKC